MSVLSIKITQADIDESICGNSARCMIATALSRHLGLNGDNKLKVNENGAAYTLDGFRYTLGISPPEKRRAKQFDKDKTLAYPHTCHFTSRTRRPVDPRDRNENRREEKRIHGAEVRKAISEGRRAPFVPQPRFV